MTGTPLDLTPFGALLGWLGHLYWLIALAIVLLALWWPKRWWLKLLSAVAVSAVVVYPVFVKPVEKHVEAVNEEQRQFNERLSAAMAHFEMRCKSSGERIGRTIENVDGVVWMKWRDKRNVNDDYDQLKLFDPYGRDCDAEGCIEQLLRITDGLELDSDRKQPRQRGYRFVESLNPGTGQLTRYTLRLYRTQERDKSYGSMDLSTELVQRPIIATSARYGITWEDISTAEDRQQWIAGGRIRVIDHQTNELIAERVGYMMDRGLGSRAGSRSPWLMARRTACPEFRGGERSWPDTETLTFASKVLHPSKTQ